MDITEIITIVNNLLCNYNIAAKNLQNDNNSFDREKFEYYKGKLRGITETLYFFGYEVKFRYTDIVYFYSTIAGFEVHHDNEDLFKEVK